MGRPREFDRDAALEAAVGVFWEHGFEGASTELLRDAMQIGRQSLYDTFGDKRALYIEALTRYLQTTHAGHIERLRSEASPLAGIEALVSGLIPAEKRARELGCMGVGSVSEFGCADAELLKLRAKTAAALRKALIARLEEARALGELARGVDVEDAARFVQTTMVGLQVGARGGESAQALRATAAFAIARLRSI